MHLFNKCYPAPVCCYPVWHHYWHQDYQPYRQRTVRVRPQMETEVMGEYGYEHGLG